MPYLVHEVDNLLFSLVAGDTVVDGRDGRHAQRAGDVVGSRQGRQGQAGQDQQCRQQLGQGGISL